MSTASGQVVASGEFAALFTVQSIYSRLVRENERSNKALWLLHYALHQAITRGLTNCFS